MLGFFKRLIAQPAPAPTPVAPAPAPVSAPVPVPTPPSPASTAPIGEFIPIPIPQIVAKLPRHLAPLAPLGGNYPLSIKAALEQLPTGAVRIRFAQLREAAPPGIFPVDASLDDDLVDIPLANVLAAINPAALSRRVGQTRLDAPADIAGIFDGKAKPTASTASISTPAAAFVPPPAPVSVPDPAPAPVPLPAAIPFSMPSAAEPAAPPSFPTATEGLAVRLSAIYETWPEPIRQEIASSDWQGASVTLPLARLDAAMKAGKVSFTWGELKGWMNMPAAHSSPLNREVSLDLPLKVIAPLFLTQRAVNANQRKVVVGDNIPNLFTVGKAPVEAPPAPAPAPTVAPAPVVTPAPVVQPAAPPAPAKIGTPQDIVKKINALPGVAASLVAMSDGLLVVGEFPAPFKTDTVAAFLPQMFGRLAHYSNEIQLGTLSALTLSAGQAPCMVIKTGSLFLAVLGCVGEPLPETALRQMADELAHCK